MNKRLQAILAVLLATVAIGSAVMAVQQQIGYRTAEASYEEATRLAGLQDAEPVFQEQEEPLDEIEEAPVPLAETPEPQPDGPIQDAMAEELAAIDLAALKEVNDDILGWITLPGTNISYPLLQAKDNTWYLWHNWDGVENLAGSIFYECQSNPDRSEFNTIIYGHRMGDGSMFSELHKYKDQAFYDEYGYVYISDEGGQYRYRIYASYEVPTDGSAYWLGNFGQAHREYFLQDGAYRSVIETDVQPTVDDQILTLSTCTGNGHETRWVVQAVLEGEIVSPEQGE